MLNLSSLKKYPLCSLEKCPSYEFQNSEKGPDPQQPQIYVTLFSQVRKSNVCSNRFRASSLLAIRNTLYRSNRMLLILERLKPRTRNDPQVQYIVRRMDVFLGA